MITQNSYHLPYHQNLNYYYYLYKDLKLHCLMIKFPYISTMKYLGSYKSQCYRYTQNSYHLPWHHNHNYYYYLYKDLKRHGSMIKCLYISTMRYWDSCDSQCYRYTQNSYYLPRHHDLNYYHYLYKDQKLHCSMIKCLYISTVMYLGSCDSQCYRYTQNTYHLPWHQNLNYNYYLYIALKRHGSTSKCPYTSTMRYYNYLCINLKRHGSMILCPYRSMMRYLDSSHSHCCKYTQNNCHLPMHYNLGAISHWKWFRGRLFLQG